MNIFMISIYIYITVYGFLKKREYILAIILVGQPIIKLILTPFPKTINENIFLMLYFLIGFFSLIIIRLVNRKKLRIGILTKKYLALYFLFCITIVISLIYTPDKSYGINKFINFFSISFLITIMSIITIDSKQTFHRTMNAIANVSIFIGMITIIVVYIKTGRITAWLSTTQAMDIKIFGINFAVNIWFGRRMGIAFLAMLFLTLLEKSRKNILKTIMLLVFIILSGSRGPIISMLITIAVIVFSNIYFKSNNWKFYRKLFFFMIITLSIIIILALFNSNNIFSRLTFFKDKNTISRINMYFMSLRYIKENFIGYGSGYFFYLTGGMHKYPHNIFIEILLELGIQGFILISIGIILTVKRYYYYLNRYKEPYFNSYLNFSFSILVFALTNAQFSGDIISNEYIWFGFIMMGKFAEIINGYLSECKPCGDSLSN